VRRLGLAPAAVATLLGTAFCRMIFHEGFVHCDPHAGNLLVRRIPAAGGGVGVGVGGGGGDGGGGGGGGGDGGGGGGGMQLVLLDHGMYRELGEHFRRSYCALWVRLLPREPQP
jgi:aarF domain-containing kinase